MHLTEAQKTWIRRIRNYGIIAILLAAIAFAMYVTVCTARGKAASVFGYRVLRVETGSMEPSLHVGDCIIVKQCDPADLREGDIISFYSEQEDIRGMLVTHRIAEIRDDGSFITRGDANPVDDAMPAHAEQIVGKYIKKARIYEWLGSFASTRKLLMLLVLLPMTIVSIYEVRSLVRLGGEIKEEIAERDREEYEQRMREAIDAEKARLAAEHYQPEDEVKKQ